MARVTVLSVFLLLGKNTLRCQSAQTGVIQMNITIITTAKKVNMVLNVHRNHKAY